MLADRAVAAANRYLRRSGDGDRDASPGHSEYVDCEQQRRCEADLEADERRGRETDFLPSAHRFVRKRQAHRFVGKCKAGREARPGS
jgi:hypothetical protein